MTELYQRTALKWCKINDLVWGLRVAAKTKNRLLDYLDKFYLGWFSPAHFDQKVEEFYFQCGEEAFVFAIYNSLKSKTEWAILVTPAFKEDELKWSFSPEIKNTYERESLIRSAIFAFRTRVSPELHDLSPTFQEKLIVVTNELTSIIQLEHQKLTSLKNFNPSKNADSVNIETITINNKSDRSPPAFFVDQLLDLELNSLEKKEIDNKLPATFSIVLEKNKLQISGFNSLKLIPAILPLRNKNQVTPLPFTMFQWRRFSVEKMPPLMEPLLKGALEDLADKHNLRVQKDQLSHMLQPLLFEHILQNNTPLFLKDNNSYRPLSIKQILTGSISFSPSENGLDLRPRLDLQDEAQSFPTLIEPIYGLLNQDCNNLLILSESMDSSHLLKFPQDSAWINLGVFVVKTPWFPANSIESVVERLNNLNIANFTIQSKALARHLVQVQPIPTLRYFDSEQGDVFFNLDFNYDTIFQKFLKSTKLQGELKLKTNPDFEKTCREFIFSHLPLETLSKTYRRAGYSFEFKTSRDIFESWIHEGADEIMARGYEVFNLRLAKSHNNSRSARIQVESHQQGQWLKLQMQLKGQPDSQLSNLDINRGFIQDKKGQLYKIHPEDLKQLRKLLILGENPTEWQVPVENPHILINFLSESFLSEKTLKLIRDTQTRFDKIREFGSIDISHQQAEKLRPYQLEGVYWLSALYRARLNACLADEMGLGKTCQSAVFLDWCQKQKPNSLHLIVVPVSALSNWANEIARFAPALKVHLYYGNQRHYHRDQIQECNTILTSYGTLLSDEQWIRKQNFHCLVIDESQTIKNSSTKTAKALKKIKSTFRIALSGTPLENNSLELHSLVDFLHPGYLGTKTWFKRRFFKPIERGEVQATRELLRKLTKPMILRRTKDEVALELPPKSESTIMLKMDNDQKEAYRRTAKYYQKRIASQIKDTGLERSGVYVLEGMLRLRQICLEPQLANSEFEGLSSVKMAYLQELLPDLINQNKRVLIFSQFTAMLEKVSWMLDGLQLPHERLEGHHNLKQRKHAVDSFQNGANLFLVSLKAGGTALNLTAADYVILIDPWWNPAAEMQAIDRAHRIGQTKPVMVYRLICENTIEEKIISLQEHKQELFDSLISNQKGPLQQLSMQEVMDLFND